MLESVSRCRSIRLRTWVFLIVLGAGFWVVPTVFVEAVLAQAEPARIKLVEGSDLQPVPTGDTVGTKESDSLEKSSPKKSSSFSTGKESSVDTTRSGLSLDLVNLANSYIDATTGLKKEELELKTAEEANARVRDSVGRIEMERLRLRLERTRLKISLFRKMAEAALESAEEELQLVTEEVKLVVEMYKAGKETLGNVLSVQRRATQLRGDVKILKLLLESGKAKEEKPVKSKEISPKPAKSKSKTEIEKTIFEKLGLKLVEDDEIPELAETAYHGGLRIVDVDERGSPRKDGIRKGDILVGLHLWETTSFEDVDFVLSHPTVIQNGKLKFYVIRNETTFYGTLSMGQY